MPRVYTSRYSNPELTSGKYTVVGVTRGAPRFRLGYELSGNIIEIAPPGYLFNENDRDRFTEPYFKHMDKVGVTRVHTLISRYLTMGKDVVLCCYEDVRKPDEWCHRLVFTEWWARRTGEIIEELQDPSEVKAPRPQKPQKPVEPQKEEPKQEEAGGVQQSLW